MLTLLKLLQILAVILHTFNDCYTSYVPEGPRIINESKEIHLKVNQHYSLKCEGEAPLKWKLPEVPMPAKEWTQFQINNTKFLRDDKVRYSNILHIQNASYPWTGFYSCEYCEIRINTKLEVETVENNIKIYIYIYDQNHLSVSTSRAIIVNRETNGSILVPCRPTSPLINISLECADKYGNRMEYQEILPTKFDPKVGFVLDKIPSFYIICNYIYNNTRSRDLIILGQKDERQMVLRNWFSYDSMCLSPGLSEHFLNGKRYFWLTPNNDGILNYYSKDQLTELGFESSDLPHSSRVKNRKGFISCRTKQLAALYKSYIFPSDSGLYTSYIEDKKKGPQYATLDVHIPGLILKVQSRYDTCGINQETNGNTTSQLIFDIESEEKCYIDIIAGLILTKKNDSLCLQIAWFNNKNSKIYNNRKYSIVTNKSTTILNIYNIDFTDSGLYKLEVQLDDLTRTNLIKLNIVSRPVAEIKKHFEYHVIGSEHKMKCIIHGSPASQIQWYYTPFVCTDGTNCKEQKSTLLNHTVKSLGNETQESVITVLAEESGYFICKAKNYLGEAEDFTQFSVVDRNEVFHLSSSWNLDRNETADKHKVSIIKGESLLLICNVSNKLHVEKITWKLNNYTLSIDNRRKIEQLEYPKVTIQELSISELIFSDSGIYSCIIEAQDEVVLQESLEVILLSPMAPKFSQATSNSSTLEVYFAHALNLLCEVDGTPKPQIEWLKDDLILTNFTRIELRNNSQILYIPSVLHEDSGTYNCKATNKFGIVSKVINLLVKNNNAKMYHWIWILVTITIVLLSITIYYCIKIQKSKQLKREIAKLNLAKFETGIPESLNPDVELNVQAEFLPYDTKWNFPKSHLKFGRKLGCGAYGVVLEAVADSIVRGEKWTKVAVKMANPNSDNANFRALISELKILVHLGTHMNIVNLLGACTENVSRKELYVILEYCPLGNVHSFLRTHTTNFVDLIDSDSDVINWVENSEIAEDQTDRNQNDASNLKSFNTKTLIEWSYQVCRAMKYLSNKNILHGDLAARNILLANNDLVKICDFGLARNLYNSIKYKKQTKELLPIKWLAIETLQSNTFSIQSDVWSFGIVLWEFFSLGTTPYPGLTTNQVLLNKLADGYRMARPNFATRMLYGIMWNCWEQSPSSRPTFTILTEIFHKMLQEIEAPSFDGAHYLCTNEEYLHNDQN